MPTSGRRWQIFTQTPSSTGELYKNADKLGSFLQDKNANKLRSFYKYLLVGD
jgi:hypothetical protein